MRRHSLTTAAAFAATVTVAIALMGCAHTPAGEASLEQWSGNHPQASEELGRWVQTHPQAAARFFEWDSHHPRRAHEFVTWSIYHPNLAIDAFVALHPGWPVFDQIVLMHRPAADGFMFWCRRHPQAAERLMNHPGGLDWAGHHLYASSWHLETPGQ
jgi:hypothetical protein